MTWFEGGYHEGERIMTTDGQDCVLSVSLGTLGWMATEVATGTQLVLVFTDEEEPVPRAPEAPAEE